MIIVLMISEKSPKKYGYLLREGDLTIDISQWRGGAGGATKLPAPLKVLINIRVRWRLMI